jgi:hypothetical protein
MVTEHVHKMLHNVFVHIIGCLLERVEGQAPAVQILTISFYLDHKLYWTWFYYLTI